MAFLGHAERENWHSTTIVAVQRNGKGAMAGDGQVSFGHTMIKANARKVRRIAKGRALAGFAGASADAMTLLERFEEKLEGLRAGEAPTALLRAAVALAKEWRTDRVLRRLEAMLVVMDAHQLLLISGNGDVIEPDPFGDAAIVAIGSGGAFALAAARALALHTSLSAAEICKEALRIASGICVFTNESIVVEEVGA
ncbi:MAG: ATP-dependent protease subunit HslV [Deltaproteobacteria bacterium]|nr:ATP-dependent protease subunit HslV [Sandaracinaceae bacterium]MCX7808090.1 ATP-dependent protease subunit HslV [Deltaproteobacteria bacterium]MDW8246225.1 ATP-dependent protease subunit HslV [Sandaracinaceae bacterium]